MDKAIVSAPESRSVVGLPAPARRGRPGAGRGLRREGFQSIPTSLQLLHEDTQRLIDVATELLNEDPELKALLRDLGARVSD